MEHRETEVRFLEINKAVLVQRLTNLRATDLGEAKLTEKILYDKALTWNDSGRQFIRLRTQGGRSMLTYKHRIDPARPDGTEEIEFTVDDPGKTEAFLERLGYIVYRHQEKLRHTFQLHDVTVDIDTWPRIPPYVEIEGPTIASLQSAAAALGFDWQQAEMRDAKAIIEQVYGIPLSDTRVFTFAEIR